MISCAHAHQWRLARAHWRRLDATTAEQAQAAERQKQAAVSMLLQTMQTSGFTEEQKQSLRARLAILLS